MKIKCEECGKIKMTRQPTTRYCSDTCRFKAKIRRRKMGEFNIRLPTGIIQYTTGKWDGFPVSHIVMLVDKDYYMQNPEWFENKAEEIGISCMFPLHVEIGIIEVEKIKLIDLIPRITNRGLE